MADYDVIVVGAGLAGLQCARLLGGFGLKVLLVDRKRELAEGVHTSGIFVRRSLEEFALPASCLGPPIRHVTLHSPSRRRLELVSPHEEFRIGRMGQLYTRLLDDCRAAGVHWQAQTDYLGCTPVDGGSQVRLATEGKEQRLKARFLVGADGAKSQIARDLDLSTNTRWIVGLEEVFEDVPLVGPPRLECYLDRRLAPGYIAWVANDGQSVHLGVGGYPDQFRPGEALVRFRESLADELPLGAGRLVERRGGRIPVGSLLARLVNERGILIGDAAGAVSPLTAGGLDPCLRLSQFAANVTWRFLAKNDWQALADYDGEQIRKAFWKRRLLRSGFDLFGRNPILEAVCFALRTLPGRLLAKKIFFGRGSFPDVGKKPVLALPRSARLSFPKTAFGPSSGRREN